MTPRIQTLELAAWDFDEYQFRPSASYGEDVSVARAMVAKRQPYRSLTAFCEQETSLHREALEAQRLRFDLQAEMHGLDWTLGVVDLRCLLAFQRRLSFNSISSPTSIPGQQDWASLIEISFAEPKPVVCKMIHDPLRQTVTLHSMNPNLHLRITKDASAPLAVHAGSPFFEVALYRSRWFLRDGYHRAFSLMQAGIFHLPAVIVRARTLDELGAVKPRFFSEAVLFSDRPPFVTDFHDEALITRYDRPLTIKTLRVTMEESIATATPQQFKEINYEHCNYTR